MQRKRVRSGYAKAARAAGNLAKRAGSATAKAIKSAAALVMKHPAAMIGIAVAVLILFIGMSLVGLFANAGTSALSGAVTASYLAENADIENAELTYTIWETELREQLENIEADYPGYDEYALDFDVDEIVHDPLALLAYLTALYQDYTLAEIETELRELFDSQYALEIEAKVETRYHDPDDSDNDGDYEPYDWHILTVTLTVTDLAELIDASLTDDQREHYEALMETGGGRQYAGSPFAFDWKPYITCLYGWRPDPFTGESDYHTGIDIGVPVGTPIIAAHSGVVTQAVWGASGYGRYITIEGENGISTRYAHCDTLLAAVGQEVEQGAVIATSGNTGNSTGPHLHYEVMLDGQHVNPIFFANTTMEESA
jgi:murein DD-endopeptidase MepM/ murein hydrolase activator NlpD